MHLYVRMQLARLTLEACIILQTASIILCIVWKDRFSVLCGGIVDWVLYPAIGSTFHVLAVDVCWICERGRAGELSRFESQKPVYAGKRSVSDRLQGFAHIWQTAFIQMPVDNQEVLYCSFRNKYQ